MYLPKISLKSIIIPLISLHQTQQVSLNISDVFACWMLHNLCPEVARDNGPASTEAKREIKSGIDCNCVVRSVKTVNRVRKSIN